jgi:hypothetical protein
LPVRRHAEDRKIAAFPNAWLLEPGFPNTPSAVNAPAMTAATRASTGVVAA